MESWYTLVHGQSGLAGRADSARTIIIIIIQLFGSLRCDGITADKSLLFLVGSTCVLSHREPFQRLSAVNSLTWRKTAARLRWGVSDGVGGWGGVSPPCEECSLPFRGPPASPQTCWCLLCFWCAATNDGQTYLIAPSRQLLALSLLFVRFGIIVPSVALGMYLNNRV